MASRSKTCVIGGGPSGLVAVKILKERGIPVTCFEKGSDIGGLWRYNNDSGTSAAYRSLHINSSRQLMAFADFPMKPDLPDFPHHSAILEYLEDYTRHFSLRDSIRFQSTVSQVTPLDNGSYRVEATDPSGERRSEEFSAVIVANGHHWSPRLPGFEGDFSGSLIHSHQYRSGDDYAGQRVLVVGIGNSGVDIACELSRIAERTVLSTRRGAHVIPKYLLGKPLDRVASWHFWTLCPLWLRQRLFAGLLKLTRGRQSRYGLPEPDYKVFQEHPTVSSELLNLLGHGKIQIRPGIEQLENQWVEFTDGRREEFDAIICATGYDIRFPFLDPQVVDPTGNRVGFYKKVVHPEHRGLFFVGLIQPWGPVMPLSEIQSEWVADLIEGKARLPSINRMYRDIRRETEQMQKRYVKSDRHTIQVDFYPYLFDIRKQRKRRRGIPGLNPGVVGADDRSNAPELAKDGQRARPAA